MKGEGGRVMKQIDEVHLEKGKFYIATYTAITNKERRYEEVFLGEDGNVYSTYISSLDEEGENLFYTWEEDYFPKDITFWEF